MNMHLKLNIIDKNAFEVSDFLSSKPFQFFYSFIAKYPEMEQKNKPANFTLILHEGDCILGREPNARIYVFTLNPCELG